MIAFSEIESPLGKIFLAFSAGGLCRVGLGITGDDFQERILGTFGERALRRDSPPAREAARQLTAYLDGRLRKFSLKLDIRGTHFQKKVWEALGEIPYGETSTYGRIALSILNPRASRAVGRACGENPLPVIIPCHRVLSSGGGPGGFTGGLSIKKYLLALEGVGIDGLQAGVKARENRPGRGISR